MPILVKSEEVKNKNPERFRIQDFLAPPAPLEPTTPLITCLATLNGEFAFAEANANVAVTEQSSVPANIRDCWLKSKE